MNSIYRHVHFPTIILLFTLLLLFFNTESINAQDEEVVDEEETENPLSITELSNMIEDTDRWIKSLEKDLELESDLFDLFEILPNKKDSLIDVLNQYQDDYYQEASYQRLEGLKAEMEKYFNNVSNHKDRLANRLDQLQTSLNDLDTKKVEWIEIEKKYRDDVAINTLLKDRLKPLMDKMNTSINYYQGIQTQELEYFNDLNLILNLIIEKQDLLNDREEELKNVILQENVPIWQISKTSSDSTSIIKKFKKGVNERKVLVTKYVEYHDHLMLFHLLLIITIVVALIAIRKKSLLVLDQRTDDLGGFLKKPLAAAYVMSYLFVGPIYDEFPQVILEIVLISLIAPIGYLIHGFINKFQRKGLIVFLFLFATFLILEVFPLLSVFGRIISLVFDIVLLICIWTLRSNSKNLQLPETGERVIKFILSIFTLTSALAIIFGFFGSVQLSHLLISGTVFSIGIGILLLLWNQFLKAFAVLFYELPFVSGIQAVVLQRDKLEQKTFNIIGIYLVFLFVEGSAHYFTIKELLIETWHEVIGNPYAFGELKVSIQDFINFFLVLVITIFLARFLKYMFGREILTKFKMERGMPNAVATTIYYFILVIGFFLAAASTGIEWSKVNLALGAIGVGIGFGLQNVIYNFISGLILIYERPIQVGDTIEFGQMMGPVTEIGIRSSKVLTYEGAEVIVPNGDLISKEVINWTYTDQLKRRELIIKTTYKANPQEVIDKIKEILGTIENVLTDPAPLLLFTGYGDGTLDFRVLFWTHLDVGMSTTSNAAIAIYDGLLKAGYELPMQKQAVVLEQSSEKKKG